MVCNPTISHEIELMISISKLYVSIVVQTFISLFTNLFGEQTTDFLFKCTTTTAPENGQTPYAPNTFTWWGRGFPKYHSLR